MRRSTHPAVWSVVHVHTGTSSEVAKIGGYEDQIQDAVLISLDRLFDDPAIEQFPSAAEVGP